jgi:transposase
MFSVELYGRVRHACHVEGLSLREAARRFGIHRNTVRKMLAFAVPPGYRRREPPARPRLAAFTAVIDRILEADRSAPPKQRHTAKRIHERLRAEHGFAGGYTIVKDYVRERRARVRVGLPRPRGRLRGLGIRGRLGRFGSAPFRKRRGTCSRGRSEAGADCTSPRCS